MSESTDTRTKLTSSLATFAKLLAVEVLGDCTSGCDTRSGTIGMQLQLQISIMLASAHMFSVLACYNIMLFNLITRSSCFSVRCVSDM